MADAISFDESFWVEEIDPCDPKSLSSVSVDYTPAFNLGSCFKDNFEVYLKYIALLDPLEADALILSHYCDKKVKEIAKIMRTTAVKISGLIHQAELRLAMLLHINLLLTEAVAEELLNAIPGDVDRMVFVTFLREISRRRTAHVTGKSFHHTSAIVRRVLEHLNQQKLSHELTELLNVLSPVILTPRETRQLDPSERTSVFDVIHCPQQVCPITTSTPSFMLGCFYTKGSNEAILQDPTITRAAYAAYFSVNQAILIQQSTLNSYDFITPPYIRRLAQSTLSVTLTTSVKVFVKPRVLRETEHPVTLVIRPVLRKRKLQILEQTAVSA